MFSFAHMPFVFLQEEEEVKPQKVSFAVKLMHFDSARKVALIKEIKAALPEMNLVQVSKVYPPRQLHFHTL